MFRQSQSLEEARLERLRKQQSRLTLEEEKNITTGKSDGVNVVLNGMAIQTVKQSELDVKQKQLELKIDKEFLPAFKLLLAARNYQQLKEALDQQIALAEREERELSSYKSSLYSLDIFIGAARYYFKDRKEERPVLDEIKKASIKWPADTLSRRMREFYELKAELEKQEQKSIESYRNNRMLFLQKEEAIREK